MLVLRTSRPRVLLSGAFAYIQRPTHRVYLILVFATSQAQFVLALNVQRSIDRLTWSFGVADYCSELFSSLYFAILVFSNSIFACLFFTFASILIWQIWLCLAALIYAIGNDRSLFTSLLIPTALKIAFIHRRIT